MDRNELIQRFFTSMDSMTRIGAMSPRSGSLPKNMPSHAQLGVLFVIAHRGTQTTKELAQHFGMTSSAATQLVNGLVKSRILERKEDAKDRRKMHIALTKKGEGVLEQARAHRMQKMKESFTPLSDEEIAQLLKIQIKIVEHWKTVCKNPKHK